LSYVESGPFSTFNNDNDGRDFYGCANVHGSGYVLALISLNEQYTGKGLAADGGLM
jgi:hypothetical protein